MDLLKNLKKNNKINKCVFSSDYTYIYSLITLIYDLNRLCTRITTLFSSEKALPTYNRYVYFLM